MIKRSESNSRCRQEYFRVPEYEEQKGVTRGSPICFLGSGIWLISRPGFRILKEKGHEIRDSGIPETELCKENQAAILAHLFNVGSSRTMT